MAGAPFGFGPPSAGPYAGLRRSVIDPVTGQPVVTSPPTGAVMQRSTVLPIGRDDGGRLVPAVPGLAMQAIEAAKFPGQVYRGEASIFDPDTGHVSDEAVGKSLDLAGTAMTGSLPFKAPKGALRMFGGAAEQSADDVLGSLEAGLAAAMKDMTPEVTPRSFVDPAAKSWDLYHGTAAPTDFARFRTDLPQEMRPNTVGSNQGQGVFFSPSADEASHYALGRGATGAGVEAGPRTIPVTVDPGKTGVLDMVELAQRPDFADRVYAAAVASHGNPTDPSQLRSIRNVVDLVHQGQLDQIASAKAFNEQYGHLGVSETPTYNYMGGGTDVAVQMAREQGLDTAIIRGLHESNGGDQVIALTPGRVRSRLSGDLLYSGGPGGAGLGAAALAPPSDAQAAPSQGTSPVTASPFSFGLGPMTDDIATRLRRGPLGIADTFRQAPEIAWPSEASAAPQQAPRSAQQPPAAVAGLANAPLPPARPPELSPPSQADLPAEGAQPMMAQPQAGGAPAAAEGPGFLDKAMGAIRQSDGLLSHIGAGLMSNARWGDGVAAGIRTHGAAQQTKAVTDLARAKFGLEVQEAQQKAGALSGNASLLKQAYPGMTDEQARASASNGSLVTEAIKRIQDKNHGRERVADSSGVQRWVDTGQPVFEGDQGKSNKLATDIAEREQALISRGMDPKDPRNEDYMLTGRRPREDQQRATASDKKVINDAEDEELALGQTIETLKQARGLNRKTFTGVGAGVRGWLGTALPDGMVPDFIADPKGAEATREFGQIMSMEAIKSMSQTLKGATTDREMARFMEILGDPSTPPDIRERTIDRMHTLALRQQQLAQSRIRGLTDGTYYKPRPEAGPADPGPARRRFDPTTGGFN